MPVVFFITHPDVAIDPSVPVPDWPRGGVSVLEQFSKHRVRYSESRSANCALLTFRQSRTDSAPGTVSAPYR